MSWALVIGAGFHSLWAYEYTPGPPATVTSAQWPGQLLQRNPDRPTLVLALHPECECSEASVEDLERIMFRAHGRVDAQVLIAIPDGVSPTRERARLRNAAAAITGVTVVDDEGGREAVRFGAHVSGQTFLFDRDGRLLFAGGITAGRGHAGDNDGAAEILAALNGAADQQASTPVFGCLLSSGGAS